MYRNLSFSTEDNVATIVLNRPKVMNALNEELCLELQQVLTEVEKNRDIKMLVLTGAGEAFCSGLDLGSVGDLNKVKPSDVLKRWFHPIILSMQSLPIPVIGKINGMAVGAGSSLALACDLILAADHANFNFSFVRIGLIPDCGAGYFLIQKLGFPKAFELTATGGKISATEAADKGLINYAVPIDQLDTLLDQYKRYFVKAPSVAVGLIKKMFRNASSMTLEEILQMESAFQDQAGATEDFKEGVTAFLEKRPPVFKGI